MRKSLFILLCLSMSTTLMAQEPVKRKEIGLVFSNLDNFGLTYKTGTEKSLWRFNTLFISGNNLDYVADSSANKRNSMGFGVKLGKEYRKAIVNNLELRYGLDVSFTYSHSKSEYDDKTVGDNDRLNEQTTYRPGINLVLGLNYILNKNLIIGVELLPDFSYTTGTSIEKNYFVNTADKEVKTDISGFNYGLSNTSALLSLSYRF
ncbi:MAG: hypothetical protein M0Q90_10530 [Bacteroidales bacterium]|nr:hypothetical protein [Bacteroidales bacterium]